MSQKQTYLFDYQGETISIQIDEVYSGDFGTTVWPSSQLLAEFIFKNSPFFHNKVVLELGCGSGLAGIAAAKCGSKLFFTDLDCPVSILDNCKYNCEINRVNDHSTVMPLRWGHITKNLFDLPSIDVIIGSDLFYDTGILDDMLCTLSILIEQNPHADLLFLFPERISLKTIESYFQRWNIAIQFYPIQTEDSVHQMVLGIHGNIPF